MICGSEIDLFSLAKKSYKDDVHGRSYDVDVESKEVHIYKIINKTIVT